MPNTKKDTKLLYNWLPTQEEFIQATTLAWIRVGCEALGLITYALKRNEPNNVNDSERSTE